MKTLILSLVVASLKVVAQTIDTGIVGSVTDPSAAPVANAEVVVTHQSTGNTQTRRTNESGAYEIRYLLPGEYLVLVKADGFRSVRRSGITLQGGQQARVEVRLEVGQVNETIDVSAAAPLLQTENATLGAVVGAERIANLPLNGRNFAQLATLTPGVTVLTQFNGLFSRVSANGARDVAMQVSFDGVSVVNNRQNWVGMFPSVDALQEFKVQSSNYTAEYGGNAGANVQVHLKSGGNQFHGTAFEFLRNDALDARGYFRPAPLEKDKLRRNQFGGVLSGPIQRDKTFFMASYEGLRSNQQRPQVGVVLTPEMRAGNFSAISTPVTDPFAANTAFPGNRIPASRLNPVSVNLVNQYMPLPNQSGVNNYSGFTGERADQNQAIVRIDRQLGTRNQVSGHYIYQNRSYPTTTFNPNFGQEREFRNQSMNFQWVRTISPTLLHEFRFGHQRGDRVELGRLWESGFKIEDLGINGFLIGGPDGRAPAGEEVGFPLMNIDGFMSIGESLGAAPKDFSRTYQFVDNLSIIRSKHSLKLGADVRRIVGNGNASNDYGVLSFTRDLSGYSAAAYMLGFPRAVDSAEGLPITGARQWRIGMYFQDDWRVTKRLTLNLGVRYDFDPAPVDAFGTSRTLRFDLNPSGPILWPDPGTSEKLWQNNFYKVAPRFGFGYRLNNKMVVRGGYGIFFTAAHFDNLNILQANPPVAPTITVTNPVVNPSATIQNPFPRNLVTSSPFVNVVSVEPDRRHWDGYLQNWNLQVGRELSSSDLVEVSYVGSKGTNLDTSINNWNSPDPGPGAIQARRPYPQWGRIRMMASDGNSVYHSLQARYERRFAKGLSATAAYTWSHLIDDTGQGTNRGGCVCQNPRARGTAERASSLSDVRQRLVLGWVWELPWKIANNTIGRTALGGWSLGGVATLQSGSPFNVTQSGDTLNNDPGGWTRPNLVGDVQLPDGQQDRALWFNPNGFSRATTTHGTAPRNPLVGPGVNTFDLSASKTFRMPYAEKHQLLFRTEVFNAFNSPQFANPASVFGNPGFATITATSIDQRQIQLALKYIF
ncbi:MAG: TonB-dependent receptor [Bryobacteraceae bacterium]|nr:TonB-dependent receptor [Bryobacteraceae bacterium]